MARSYAQRDAQLKAMEAARGAAARRAEARDREARDAAERERELAEHVHGWKNWEYVLDYTHEVRECRVCGYAEMRKVRF
jgi:hypothetical protein